MGYLGESGIGWYRKNFTAPIEWKSYKIFIEFDGMYKGCEVWINGHSVGTHKYGYTAFYFALASAASKAIWGDYECIG